jgi:broad specificity phosphatase PhoE
LTPHGVEQVTATATLLVGKGKLIDPTRVHHIWVSPRKRALQTFQRLFGGDESDSDISVDDDKATVTEDLAEWDYGDYEGLLADEIRQKRKAQGLDTDRAWKIWADGCEGGEYENPRFHRLTSHH